MERIQITVPRIEADHVQNFALNEAKGYVLRDGERTYVIVSGKSVTSMVRIMCEMAAYVTRFLKG